MRMTDAGTVAAGKSADFLVLDANPLDDITNTRRISERLLLRGNGGRSRCGQSCGRVGRAAPPSNVSRLCEAWPPNHRRPRTLYSCLPP